LTVNEVEKALVENALGPLDPEQRDLLQLCIDRAVSGSV
jgi:hypothetical protein